MQKDLTIHDIRGKGFGDVAFHDRTDKDGEEVSFSISTAGHECYQFGIDVESKVAIWFLTRIQHRHQLKAELKVMPPGVTPGDFLSSPKFVYGATWQGNFLEQALEEVLEELNHIPDCDRKDRVKRSLAYIYQLAEKAAQTPAKPSGHVFEIKVPPNTPDRHGDIFAPGAFSIGFKLVATETITLDSPEEDLAKITPEQRKMLESGLAKAIITKIGWRPE